MKRLCRKFVIELTPAPEEDFYNVSSPVYNRVNLNEFRHFGHQKLSVLLILDTQLWPGKFASEEINGPDEPFDFEERT